MKNPLLILSVAAILAFLPSCSTYVNDGGYAASRPVHRTNYGYRPAPAPYRAYPASYTQTRFYNSRTQQYRSHRDHDHRNDDYRRVSQPKRYPREYHRNVQVNTGVGLRVIR